MNNEDSGDENDTGDASRAKNSMWCNEGKSIAEMFKPTSGASLNAEMVVKSARKQNCS